MRLKANTVHKCAKAVQEMKIAIFLKFCLTDPPLNNNGLSLTPKRLDENKEPRKKNNPLAFNPLIRIEETPEGCIRVFTTPGVKNKDPAKRKQIPMGNKRQTMATIHFKGSGKGKKPEQTWWEAEYGMERGTNKM